MIRYYSDNIQHITLDDQHFPTSNKYLNHINHHITHSLLMIIKKTIHGKHHTLTMTPSNDNKISKHKTNVWKYCFLKGSIIFELFFCKQPSNPEIIMLSVGTSGPSHPIFIYQVKQSDHDVDEFINKEKSKKE